MQAIQQTVPLLAATLTDKQVNTIVTGGAQDSFFETSEQAVGHKTVLQYTFRAPRGTRTGRALSIYAVPRQQGKPFWETVKIDVCLDNQRYALSPEIRSAVVYTAQQDHLKHPLSTVGGIVEYLERHLTVIFGKLEKKGVNHWVLNSGVKVQLNGEDVAKPPLRKRRAGRVAGTSGGGQR